MQQLAYQLWRGGWGQKLLACLAAALLVAASVAAQPLPKPMSPPRLVNDFTSLLTEQEQQALEHKLRR
ncbi:MAG: hypothetical protein LBS63_00215, partial [Prevotellaceae bacterium]|nr:hypothetical protein [Prevotellaceae bacterium]